MECKRTISGFYFRYKLDANKCLDGLVFMTPRNRYNLIPFGKKYFLDTQNRRMNKFCWSYIGPSIKNGGNKVDIVCESIVTGETVPFYAWILKMIEEIEPRWKVSHIKLIFADNFIADELLSSLGIYIDVP